MSETIIQGPCASCPGACCGFADQQRSWSLVLTLPEAKFMGYLTSDRVRNGGAVTDNLKSAELYDEYIELLMDDVTAPSIIRMYQPNANVYHFTGPCVHGTQQGDGSVICKVRSDPQRPNVCADFQAGSLECRQLRQSLRVQDRP